MLRIDNDTRTLLLWICAALSLVFALSFIFADNQNNEYAYRAPQTEQQTLLFGISSEGWTALFTGTLVLATAALCAITYLLVRLGHEQSETTRAQLRAYALVAKASVVNLKEGEPEAIIKIKNFGQTPARKIRVGMGIGTEKWPFAEFTWPVFDPSGNAKSVRVLGPNDDFVLRKRFPSPIDPGLVMAICDGTWAFWVTGKVVYEDVFGEERVTEFCMFTTKITGIGKLAAVEDRNTYT